jgi:predicted phage terminase large subunit-like protein
MQTPLPESGIMLRPEWLMLLEDPPLQVNTDLIVQSWDTAQTANESSAYSVCLTFLIRNKNEFFLLDVCRERLEYPDLKRRVVDQWQKYHPEKIVIEDKNTGGPLIQELIREGLTNVLPWKPERDKATRMRGQTLILESCKLRVPRHAPWLPDFRTEYLAFPNSRSSDQIDAMSQFFEWYHRHLSRGTFECSWGDEYDGEIPTPEEYLWRIRSR